VALVDQYGFPIKRAELLEEQAVPRMTSVRNVHHQYSSAGLIPQRLAQYMRQADEGDALAYLELAEQIEEKDGHYVGVLGQRKRAVTGLEITVEAASEEPRDQQIAQLVRDWVERDELRSDLFDIMDAVGKGYSVCEIIWNNDNPGVWTIERIEWRDPRWFGFDRIDGRTVMLKGDGGMLQPLTPWKFIVHQVKAKSGIPIRGGIVRPCAWYWLYKNFSLRDWVIFAEAYGQPLRIGKYGAGSSDEDRRVLLRAVANLGSDAGAIVPDSMSIEFIKDMNQTGSVDLFERLSKYCDEQISKAVLGQTTTSDSLSGGGLAGNQSHNDVRGDIADDDAASLASTLNRQLVKPLVDINFGQQKKYPRIRMRRPESVDLYPTIAALQAFVGMGGKVSSKRAADMLSLPVAAENEEVLTPPMMPMSQAAIASARFHKAGEHLDTAAQRQTTDAIDAVADELAGEWLEVLAPMQTMIEAALNEASTFDEFSDKLLALANRESPQMAARMEKAMFATRLAGNLQVKLDS
jgi:phage gp29-like protein